MDCRNFQKNLEDYLEGGLDFAGRFGMERHARQCYVCGKQVTIAQKLSQLARAQDRTLAPQNFESAVMDRIHLEDSLSWFQRARIYGLDFSGIRPYALWATSMLVLGLGVYVVADRYSVPHDADSALARQTAPAAPVTAPLPRDPDPLPLKEPVSEAQSSPLAESVKNPYGQTRPQSPTLWTAEPFDPESSKYLQYTVPGPDGRLFIMRLPKTIRMRYGQPSEEYFIRNISH